MFFHRLYMRRVVTHSEDAAVNLRIQRLYAAVHDLGKPRDIADISNGNARVLDRLHRAAGRDDFNARFVEFLCKLHDTVFI